MRAVGEFRKTHVGLERLEVYINRRNGTALTVSLWSEYDAMRAASDDADTAREDVALETLGWVERVDEYELVDDA